MTEGRRRLLIVDSTPENADWIKNIPRHRNNLIGWHNLYCPSCKKHGVSIKINDALVRDGWKPCYGTTCSHCLAIVNFLGQDGTLRTAVAEWKRVCRTAIKLEREKSMSNGQQMELDVNAFLGVTDWLDPSKQPPAHAGWYDVRFKMSDEEREAREPHEGRRWWHPGQGCFSRMVPAGANFTPEELEDVRKKLSSIHVSSFEYRGSREPMLTEHIFKEEEKKEEEKKVVFRRR